MSQRLNYKKGLFITALLNGMQIFAQQQAATSAPASESYFRNPVFILLFSVALLLLLVIAGFGSTLKNVITYRRQKGSGKKLLTLALLFTAIGSQAQEASTASIVEDPTYWGVDPFIFWFLISVIALEVYVLFSLINIFNELKTDLLPHEKTADIMQQLTASVPVEEEGSILFDHEYDGIRELDNDLPPWWKYMFYATIIFAVIYIARYHFSPNGILMAKAYEIEMEEARVAKEAYMKTLANNIDETNVTIGDALSISTGKNLYMDNCVACHGRFAEGGVGPNLTDDYWLHGGNIKDVFKSIKYGIPDKGMKSWQAEFAPDQLQALASFIKSVHGTNPEKAKAPQGELYSEKITNDSTAVKTAVMDSTAVVKKDSVEVKK